MPKCVRCQHEWETRYDRKPVQCPSCHSPRWDVPRKVKGVNREAGIEQRAPEVRSGDAGGKRNTVAGIGIRVRGGDAKQRNLVVGIPQAGNQPDALAPDDLLCGFSKFNEIDGETYQCCLEPHGPEVLHAKWKKL